MRASLVSATSIAALLALEAGPAAAGPVFDLSTSGSAPSTCNNVASPSSCSLTFYALPSTNSITQTVTMKADVAIQGTQTFSAAPSGFTGAGKTNNKGLGNGSSLVSNAYGFTGAASASTLGETVTSTGSGSAAVAAGNSGKGGNAAQTSPLAFQGVTVAPIQSVSNTNAGFVLVGNSASVAVTVTNTGHGNLATGGPSSQSNLQGSVGGGDSIFQGSGGTLGAGSDLADGKSQSFTYTFTPTVKASASTTTIVSTFTNGNASGSNGTDTASSTLSGQGVAPVNSVSGSTSAVNPTIARYSTKGPSGSTASVTVTNTGNGNLAGADNGTTLLSNLRGSMGGPTPTNPFTGAGGAINLTDGGATTFNYTYSPTQRGTNSANVTATFTNGSSDGMNKGQAVTTTLFGQGVGPTYQSRLGTTAANAPTGTINTPPANTGSSTIAFGTVGAFTHNALFLDLGNISTDPNGGNTQLTDLSIKSFTITGPQHTAFALAGTVPTVLHEGKDTVLELDFNSGGAGSYAASLMFTTDQGAPFDGLGDTFSYALSGFVTAAPEPASLLLLSAGLGGLFAVRRRKAT